MILHSRFSFRACLNSAGLRFVLLPCHRCWLLNNSGRGRKRKGVP